MTPGHQSGMLCSMKTPRIRWAAGAVALACACGSSDENGDTRQQALSYATNDIACTTAADCCAVLDGCLAQLLVVAAADKSHVEGLLASAPQDPCVGCMPPPVQVDCVGGICVGAALVQSAGAAPADYPSEFARTHCGTLPVPSGWEVGPSTQSEDVSPGLSMRTVIGCH